jgi:L-iditol 2-dehydrogenase
MTTQSDKPNMTAIVCHAPKDYRVEQVSKPRARAHELVIRIAACGICASDCKCYSGAKMFWGGPSPWVKAPVIPGHEFFGYVEEIGVGAAEHFGVKQGERVIAEQIVPCGKCRYCKSGQYWMCEVHNIFGFQREVADGGMAEYMRIPPTAIVHKIPDGISLEDAAIIEPLACAIHTVNRGDVQLDDVVVIAGAGPLGLMMTQVAHLKTPKKLVVIDLVEERLALAREYGADVTINPQKEDALAIIRSLTDGYGCDVYIETTGAPIGVRRGYDARLVGDRRPQGTRRARRASWTLLLSDRNRSAGAWTRHVERHRHARLFSGRVGRGDQGRELARFDQGVDEAACMNFERERVRRRMPRARLSASD